MITNPKREEYRIRAWYYKPIIDNSGASSLDWEKIGKPFWCRNVNKKRSGIELIPNGIATSNDREIETDSLLDFEDKGKIVFAYKNPIFENAERITKDGITTYYEDEEQGNKFTKNRKVRKRIKVG